MLTTVVDMRELRKKEEEEEEEEEEDPSESRHAYIKAGQKLC